ncbi:MAG: SprT family zinc-dependent metalloprotease [Arenicellales bacterium]
MLKSLWRKKIIAPTVVSPAILQLGETDIHWRKSARRKRSLALKVNKAGDVVVMTPMRTTKKDVMAFIRAKQSWIQAQVSQRETAQTAQANAQGKTIAWMGEHLKIIACLGPKNKLAITEEGLEITSRQTLDKPQLNARALKWLRAQAEMYLPQRLAVLSDSTGLQGNGFQIKSYTARWGSCRHDGLIQINWKLIKVPSEVIDYVIIHELSHLKHFDHSPAFWAEVARHCADYKTHRLWLKRNGGLLIND